MTALHRAASKGHAEVVSVLLGRGASVEAKDDVRNRISIIASERLYDISWNNDDYHRMITITSWVNEMWCDSNDSYQMMIIVILWNIHTNNFIWFRLSSISSLTCNIGQIFNDHSFVSVVLFFYYNSYFFNSYVQIKSFILSLTSELYFSVALFLSYSHSHSFHRILNSKMIFLCCYFFLSNYTIIYSYPLYSFLILLLHTSLFSALTKNDINILYPYMSH